MFFIKIKKYYHINYKQSSPPVIIVREDIQVKNI